MPLREVKQIPGPISANFTVKEAANTHLILNVLVIISETGVQMPDGFDVVLAKRVCREFEKQLKKAGCVLDERGWMV